MSLSASDLFIRIIENTPFSEPELALLILTAPTRYKEHFIGKRNGRGKRLISQPTAELKLIQRWLIRHELTHLPIDPHATAYRTGLSIKDQVEHHTHSHFLLKLDFENFFPSLTDKALQYRLCRDTNYSETDVFILTRLLCRKPRSEDTYRLSIGAPSSPHISNYLLIEFDQKLSAYCNANSLTYSRYADDIAISSTRARALDPAHEFVIQLLNELNYLGLKLNDEKTINVSKKYRRELVGLVVSNQGNVSLGRDEKRKLRAAIHAYSLSKLTADEISRLRGQIAYSRSIEPEFVENLFRRHGIASIK